MNKKLKALFALTVLLSRASIAYECNTSWEPCEQTSPFCGGYIGANFNFGSVSFLKNQTMTTELATEENGINEFFLLEDARRDFCLHEALNTVGGGLTLGWSWSNSCWYLATEFNGLFYSNPSSNSPNDSCDTTCDKKCCGYLSIQDNQLKADTPDPELNDITRLIYQHNYKNNVRLDGIIKFGFLSNQNTALYLLAGGSGLLVKYEKSFSATSNFTIYPDRLTLFNDPNNSSCCNKWIGGGTFGVGLRSSWRNCFDLFVEGRYAKYTNTCYNTNKPNNVSDGFKPNYLIPAESSEIDTIKFKTSSYLILTGINWLF